MTLKKKRGNIDMRNLKYIFGLALVLLASCFVASCNDDVKETLEQECATVLDN